MPLLVCYRANFIFYTAHSSIYQYTGCTYIICTEQYIQIHRMYIHYLHTAVYTNIQSVHTLSAQAVYTNIQGVHTLSAHSSIYKYTRCTYIICTQQYILIYGVYINYLQTAVYTNIQDVHTLSAHNSIHHYTRCAYIICTQQYTPLYRVCIHYLNTAVYTNIQGVHTSSLQL